MLLKLILRSELLQAKQHLFKRSFPLITKQNSSGKPPDDRKEQWHEIYRLPAGRFLSSLSKLKNYQVALTLVGTPAAFLLQSEALIPDGTAIIFTSIGVSGCLTFTLVGLMAKNLIGFIYTNNSCDKVKIAFIDFWGKRRDTELAVEDIIYLNQSSDKIRAWKIVQTNEPSASKYKLLKWFGKITDASKFVAIFGE